MLIRFSVQNFRSFGQTAQTLDMVSSTKIRQHPQHVCTVEDSKILRNAVVYGANAAGKSNLIKALEVFVEVVRRGSLPQGLEQSFCRTEIENEAKETTFDIQIEVDGRCYDYGFSAILSKRIVTGEWLYSVSRAGAKPLFERKGRNIGLGIGLEEKALETRFQIYRDDFLDSDVCETSLFLSNVNSGRSFALDSDLGFFQQVYRWCMENVVMVGAGKPSPTCDFYLGSTLDEVSDLLASFDTGISRLEKRSMSFDELGKALPPNLMEFLRASIAEHAGGSEKKVAGVVRGEGVLAGIGQDEDGELRATILKLHHGASPFEYDFGDESDGTRRLFDFVDMILTSRNDTLFVVDELSRSLHPLLTQHFIKVFNEVHKDDCCQLVFTTHENDIMSFDYFRRDEVWFVERGDGGESTLYSLDDFADTVKSDARIGKQYLEGRYGGIPVLSVVGTMLALEEQNGTA